MQTAKADDHPGDSRWTALPKRETIGKAGGELFSPHGWTPPVQAQAQPTREVAAKPVAPDGKLIEQAAYEQQLVEWIPSEADRVFVHSLMQRVIEPGKIAGWIAPPERGVNNLPVEYAYVKLH